MKETVYIGGIYKDLTNRYFIVRGIGIDVHTAKKVIIITALHDSYLTYTRRYDEFIEIIEQDGKQFKRYELITDKNQLKVLKKEIKNVIKEKKKILRDTKKKYKKAMHIKIFKDMIQSYELTKDICVVKNNIKRLENDIEEIKILNKEDEND